MITLIEDVLMFELGSDIAVVVKARVVAVDDDHIHVEIPATPVSPRVFMKFPREEFQPAILARAPYIDISAGERQPA